MKIDDVAVSGRRQMQGVNGRSSVAKRLGRRVGETDVRSLAAKRFGYGLCLGLAITGLGASAEQKLPPRLYEVTTETGMPHLEASLRYSDTREERCLGGDDWRTAFPILRHASLANCTLQDETLTADTISYVLTCTGGHGTSGSATWLLGEHLVRGTLTVKLGGKNMTFYQRVTARPLGACTSANRP